MSQKYYVPYYVCNSTKSLYNVWCCVECLVYKDQEHIEFTIAATYIALPHEQFDDNHNSIHCVLCYALRGEKMVYFVAENNVGIRVSITHTPMLLLKVMLASAKSTSWPRDVRYIAPPSIPAPLFSMNCMSPCTSTSDASILRYKINVCIISTSAY